MPRKVGRPKAGDEPLTHDLVLATALRLVDASGVEALSMRRLAAELGVDPMALYRYVDGRQALLDALTERVFAELQLPPLARLGWRDQVRAFARAYRDLVMAHPRLALHLIQWMQSGAPALLAANEALYAALAAADLPDDALPAAADLIIDYLHGWALGTHGGENHAGQGLAALISQYPPERFPTLSRLMARQQHASQHIQVEAGIEIILDGIAAQVALQRNDDTV